MKRKKIIILILIILSIIILGLIYNYTFNSKHRDIAKEEASITLSSKELYSQFQKNELLATTNYLDKVIEIQGEITSIDEKEIVISNQIQVNLNVQEMNKVINKTLITIKGRCVGYDELLEMVKIDQATIINKKKLK
jgi:hypothetical protein